MADEIKNVFISHVHEDHAGLSKLKDLIAKGGLTVRDSSMIRPIQTTPKIPTISRRKSYSRKFNGPAPFSCTSLLRPKRASR